RSKQLLGDGGMGHAMSIHSRNDDVILQFGLHKPAFRICVSTPTTHGSIGFTTGLDPSMTLGCGGFGGNITSDNISPRHLLNIKRVAYETRPVAARRPAGPAAGAGASSPQTPPAPPPGPRLPQAPRRPAPEPISAESLTRRIDAFLHARGLAARAAPSAASIRPEPPPSAGLPTSAAISHD